MTKLDMAALTYLCEIKSCTLQATNVFETRGGDLYLCDAHSFVSFRSPEYLNWQMSADQDAIPALFSDHFTIRQNGDQRSAENGETLENSRPLLKVLKLL